MHLFDGQLNNTLVHPSRFLQLLNESVFDVRNNLVSEDFCLLRESFFDEESTQNPAKTIIYMIDASSPALWYRFRVLVLSVHRREKIQLYCSPSLEAHF